MILICLLVILVLILMLGSTLLIRTRNQEIDLTDQIERLEVSLIEELEDLKNQVDQKRKELEQLNQQLEQHKKPKFKEHYTIEEAKEIDWKNVTFK